MQVIRTIAEMREASAEMRAEKKRVAFVPTMGALHQGHLHLLEEAATLGSAVLSIFVNPTQFGPNEDFSRYPRSEQNDLDMARRAGVEVAFLPTVEEIYPVDYQTFVDVGPLTTGLCGAKRPGHFRGVTTVVLKLLNIVQPEVAFFGEKDFQQLTVIRRMISDLALDIEIRGLPIVREADGLALSSRNAYLTPSERALALSLSQALSAADAAYSAGERHVSALLTAARTPLDSAAKLGDLRLDYLELCDRQTLKPLSGEIIAPAQLLVAAFVGKTRLIDNRALGL